MGAGAPGRPARHWDVLALALVGGLVLFFFWRPLLTANVYLPTGGGDLASFFFPLYTFIHRSVQETGQLPLWNPYAFSGAPLAADVQSGLWYPPNWLVWYGLPVPAFGANFTGDIHSTYALIEWQVILHYLPLIKVVGAVDIAGEAARRRRGPAGHYDQPVGRIPQPALHVAAGAPEKA